MASAQTRPVAAEDLFKMTFLNAALLSPDGAHVLVGTKKMNGPKNSYERAIDLIEVRTGAITANVTGKIGDGDYAWMPDGASFVFIRRAPGAMPQLYRYTLGTKQVVQLTRLAPGVSSPVVSHDGKHIALSVNSPDAQPNTYVDFTKAGFEPTDEEKKSDIRTIDRLFFETNGQGYTYQDHLHIWIVDADGGNAKQLTFGRWSEAFDAWSPDDRTILFDSLQRESVDQGPNDVYIVSANGGQPSKLPSEDVANNGLFYSVDGNRILTFRSGVTDNAAYASLDSTKIDGNDAQTIVAKNTVSWGDSVLGDMREDGGLCMRPLPNGKQALVNVDGPGYSNLRIVDLANGELTDVTAPKGEAWSCSISADGKTAAYLYSDFTHPADVYVADLATGETRQLTNVNAAYLALVTLSTPQEFWVDVPAGQSQGPNAKVQAWFMPATGGTRGTKHATLLEIHGGPELQFGDTFFQEFQYYASLGYNIVFTDPAGSTGHGYAFEEALESDFGDAMFADVEAAMNVAVERPDVDSDRLGVLGGSYGGYAVLWVIAHTNRYKAAVGERVGSFLQSENLAADFAGKNGLGGGYYTWGPPWDPASTSYAKFSPLTYVENVRASLLILHSDLDTRATIDQTLQEFTALKILGRDVTYVAVPNENHNLSRTGSPIHRVERLNLIAGWLANYLHP